MAKFLKDSNHTDIVGKSRFRSSSYKRRRKGKKTKDFGLRVYVNNGDVSDALRRLKKRIEKSKLMEEVKGRQYFEKPSIKKRRQRNRNKFIKPKGK